MAKVWDTIIVGAGPAGLMAAGSCSGTVLVLDRMDRAGRKLLVTGGGRCNITHDTDVDGVMDAFGRTGRFMRQALMQFGPSDIRSFLAEHGVPTCVETDGSVFPQSQKAGDVLKVLENEARRNGAEFVFGARIEKLLIENGAVAGVLAGDGALKARRVILCAGGRSYPELGADGSGFELARDCGLAVRKPVPALVGLFVKQGWIKGLAGVTLSNACVRVPGKGMNRQGYCGPLLFTHRGISGPPVLAASGEVSARLAEGEKYVPVEISVDAGRTEADWLVEIQNWRMVAGTKKFVNQLATVLVRSLALAMCDVLEIGENVCARLRAEDEKKAAHFLAGFPLTVTGTEGWARAMITRGGVELKELDPASMACRRIGGLYCAGEIVDLDGICGGFNLTWALASGRLAGPETCNL